MPPPEQQLPRICFDDEYRNSKANATNLSRVKFHNTVKGVLEIMEAQAKRIEIEKLKAIGQRNRVDNEVENRNRQKLMLEVLIKEKQTELERYCQQYASLTKIEDEQQQLIDKLSNNEA
ncbi:hypothetical protein Ae201684P_021796 [Aphanomyces euteiches]|nr:hypothetical protein Ae201684P_021796 [Aphanomyces euteiches]